jgi:hypothetical protein
LRDTRVLFLTLIDVNGIIIKVVVDVALSDSIVLTGTFDDMLVEVADELKDLNN